MKAKNYGWQNNNEELSHSYLVPTVLSNLEKRESKKMLDIGAGNGSLLKVWRNNNLEVKAIEPDEQGFNFCQEILGKNVLNIGVGDELPNDWKNTFDTVVCLEVVEHLFNPNQLVESCNMALSKDGIVIISTPYHGYLKNLALAIAGKWDFHHHPNRVGGHIKFFSQKTLVDLFKSQGYELLEFKGVGRFSYLWKSIFLVFKKK